MTFVLVSVVYAVAIGEPSFGVMGPFAVGLALFAMVFAGVFCTPCSSIIIHCQNSTCYSNPAGMTKSNQHYTCDALNSLLHKHKCPVGMIACSASLVLVKSNLTSLRTC